MWRPSQNTQSQARSSNLEQFIGFSTRVRYVAFVSPLLSPLANVKQETTCFISNELFIIMEYQLSRGAFTLCVMYKELDWKFKSADLLRAYTHAIRFTGAER